MQQQQKQHVQQQQLLQQQLLQQQLLLQQLQQRGLLLQSSPEVLAEPSSTNPKP